MRIKRHTQNILHCTGSMHRINESVSKTRHFSGFGGKGQATTYAELFPREAEYMSVLSTMFSCIVISTTDNNVHKTLALLFRARSA